MIPENQDALLQEYARCDEKIGRLDSLVWQMAAILFPLTIGAFAFFGLSATHGAEQFAVVLVVALGSSTFIFTWYRLALQWHGYQDIAYYRMREIETELGMWHYRYAGLMSQQKNEVNATLAKMDSDSEKQRYLKMKQFIGAFPLMGLHGALRWITILFLSGWVFLLLRELLLSIFSASVSVP